MQIIYGIWNNGQASKHSFISTSVVMNDEDIFAIDRQCLGAKVHDGLEAVGHVLRRDGISGNLEIPLVTLMASQKGKYQKMLNAP